MLRMFLVFNTLVQAILVKYGVFTYLKKKERLINFDWEPMVHGTWSSEIFSKLSIKEFLLIFFGSLNTS